MKKSLVIAAIASFVLTSCAKDYSCVCTDKTGGVVTGTDTYPIKNTKKKATETCDLLEESSTTFGISSETTCELK